MADCRTVLWGSEEVFQSARITPTGSVYGLSNVISFLIVFSSGVLSCHGLAL